MGYVEDDIAQLRAEVERMKGLSVPYAEHERCVVDYAQTIATLRAENERLKGICDDTWLNEAEAENERLRELLVDLPVAYSEAERLRGALEAVVSDILEYEKTNNLSPNPGREYCWDSVARARAALQSKGEL